MSKMTPPCYTPMGTIAMPAERLQWLLRRVAAGEDPDLVLIEETANADQVDLRTWIDRRASPDPS